VFEKIILQIVVKVSFAALNKSQFILELMHSSKMSLIFLFQASILRSLTGAGINLILIMLMANVYTAVAELLTKWGKSQ